MPRPRTPTALLDARGAFRNHPDRKRDGEPEQKDPIGAPPSYLTEAQRERWNEILDQCAPGVLTKCENGTVAMAAIEWSAYLENPAEYQTSRLGLLHKMLGQFGLTPSERAKLSIGKPGGEANPFDNL